MFKLIIILLAAIGLQGCLSLPTPYVSTSTTTFQGESHASRGSIIIAPIDKTQQDSLEFKTVSTYVLQKLVEQGYTKSNTTSSQFTAYVTYGIDNGQTTISSIPIGGQTGGGATYSTGTITSGGRTSSYSGSGYTMPTYGMIGTVTDSDTKYKRVLNIDIFQNNNNQKPNKVYEIKAVSTGSCGNINSILYLIIDGAFKNFPGENGKTRIVNADWNGSC